MLSLFASDFLLADRANSIVFLVLLVETLVAIMSAIMENNAVLKVLSLFEAMTTVIIGCRELASLFVGGL
jgi:hypothetical protein